MYLYQTITENVKAAALGNIGGPLFSEEQAARADKMEIWASEFTEPGPDYCLFRLFEKEVQIGTKRQNGY
jgi:hypothetical protein